MDKGLQSHSGVRGARPSDLLRSRQDNCDQHGCASVWTVLLVIFIPFGLCICGMCGYCLSSWPTAMPVSVQFMSGPPAHPP